MFACYRFVQFKNSNYFTSEFSSRFQIMNLIYFIFFSDVCIWIYLNLSLCIKGVSHEIIRYSHEMVTSEKQGNMPTILSSNPYVLVEQLEFTHLTEISKACCCKSPWCPLSAQPCMSSEQCCPLSPVPLLIGSHSVHVFHVFIFKISHVSETMPRLHFCIYLRKLITVSFTCANTNDRISSLVKFE